MSDFKALNWKFPLAVVAVWVVIAAALFGVAQATFGTVLPLTSTFIHWDAGWYYGVALHGYALNPIVGQANIVFFPLYPLIVATVHHVVPIVPLLAMGVVVSIASFAGALVLLYDFTERKYDRTVAQVATLLLAFNPFGFFFGLVYTESLFLLLSVLVFWAMQRKLWWLAAAAAGLASATRVVGLVLAVMVLAQWLWQQRPAWRRPERRGRLAAIFVGLGVLSCSGLVGFCVFLQLHNHDALMFVHLQRYWNRTGPGNLITEFRDNFHQLLHNFRTLHVYEILDRLNAYTIWYLATLAGFAGLGLLVWQREYWLATYVALGMALPLASGTVGSTDRYVMVLFPLYIGVAKLLGGRERWLVVGVSGLLWVFFWLLYLSQQMFFG